MIGRLEKAASPVDTALTMLKGWQTDMWTALPGIIETVDFSKQTCTVKPALQMPYIHPQTGDLIWKEMPLLLDCPMQFPGSGGITLTFPVSKGDDCLVVFASRCIDTWWQSGGHNNQLPDYRMHDLSDGFVILGFRSIPSVVPNISPTEAQLRTNDGQSYVSLNPTTGKLTIKAEIDVIGNINHTGNNNLNGNFAHDNGSMTSLGKKIDGTHNHGGIQIGLSNTMEPNP